MIIYFLPHLKSQNSINPCSVPTEIILNYLLYAKQLLAFEEV